MIEYKDIQGSIEAITAPINAPFTVILKTTASSISDTNWAILLRKAGSWGVCCSPGIYKDGEVKSGKLIFEITDIHDLFSTIDMRLLVSQKVHLAVVFTATNCKFYLNGVLISDIVHTAQPGAGGTVYTNEPYLGFTEYARIWAYALTQTEIQADMTDIIGTITCGGPYVQNTSHILTGSVISGGTAPFTYTWTITPPTGNVVTLTGASQTYTFAQVGAYSIDLDILDSCLSGGRTNRTSCSVTVTAPCVDPLGHINID